MTTKHTGGEWIALEDCVYAEGKRVADCYCEGDNFADGEPEANAKLIAKTPNLLHHCHTAAALLEGLVKGGQPGATTDCLAQVAANIRATIAETAP